MLATLAIRIAKKFKSVTKKAFTLIELILVIILIGLFYSIFLSNFTISNKQLKDFKNLKDFLLTQNNNILPIHLHCKNSFSQDQCQCKFYTNDIKNKKTIQIFKVGQKPTVLTFNKNGYLDQKFKEDDNTCFSFDIRTNKSSSNTLVELDGKYYLFYALFRNTAIFNDYETASNAFNQANFLPTTKGEFYPQL